MAAELIYIFKDNTFLQASESVPLQEYKFAERKGPAVGAGAGRSAIYIF